MCAVWRGAIHGTGRDRWDGAVFSAGSQQAARDGADALQEPGGGGRRPIRAPEALTIRNPPTEKWLVCAASQPANTHDPDHDRGDHRRVPLDERRRRGRGPAAWLLLFRRVGADSPPAWTSSVRGSPVQGLAGRRTAASLTKPSNSFESTDAPCDTFVIDLRKNPRAIVMAGSSMISLFQ
jgi:hypothetical protein